MTEHAQTERRPEPDVSHRGQQPAQRKKKETAFYRLKAGSHSTGVGLDSRHYHASDPKNNIVESEENLAAWDPGKFERYEGPVPEYARHQQPDEEDLPPGPTTDLQRMEAEAMKARTPEEARDYAQRLREQADLLEEQASKAEKSRQSGKEQEKPKEQQPSKTSPDTSPATKTLTPEQQRAQDARLDQMTVDELRELAEDEEIELRSNMRKDEIVQAIRQARKK